jgi:hypothetical protein
MRLKTAKASIGNSRQSKEFQMKGMTSAGVIFNSEILGYTNPQTVISIL